MLLAHRRTVLFTAADPYPEVGNGLVMDFAGLRTGGSRTYARNGGVRADSPTGIAGWSYSRTGELIVPDGDGLLRAVAANDPGIDPGLVTGAGLPVYEATTNKCTNYNAAPPVLITPSASATFNAAASAASVGVTAGGGDANTLFGIVDASASLASSDLAQLLAAAKLNGRVYRADNTTGAATAALDIGGQAGNTNSHTYSIWLRGSGTARIQSTNVAGGAITLTSTWTRYTVTLTPATSASVLRLTIAVGGLVEGLLNQAEEKAYATPPVIVSGASASRGAVNANVDSLTSILAYPFVAFVSADLAALDGIKRDLLTISDGSITNYFQLTRGGSGLAAFQSRSSNVNNSTVDGPTRTGARRLSMSIYAEANGFTPFVDGAAVGSKVTVTAPLNLSAMRIGNGFNPATAYLNSPILRCGIIPGGSAALAQQLSTAA